MAIGEQSGVGRLSPAERSRLGALLEKLRSPPADSLPSDYEATLVAVDALAAGQQARVRGGDAAACRRVACRLRTPLDASHARAPRAGATGHGCFRVLCE